MTKRFLQNSSLALLIAAATAFPFAVQAQEASSPDERSVAPADEAADSTIVVTAQRRAQRLQDVPVAVSAVGSAQLEQRQIVSISDLVRVAPSFQAAGAYGEGGPPNYLIRGITSTDFTTIQSKPIAIFYNDAIRNSSVFEVVPLFDLERVEVLRGPQGTLYGKNATGGAVNIVPKEPGFDTEGYVTAGYGSFDRRFLRGAVQTAVVDDVLSIRLSGTYTKDNGIYRNLTLGFGDTSQTDIFAFRGMMRYRPSSSFDATLAYTHVGIGGRNLTILPVNLNLSAYPSLANLPGVNRDDLGFWENRTDSNPKRRLRSDGLVLKMNASISSAIDLTSITSYDDGAWFEPADGDGLPIKQAYLVYDTKAKQFSQELRLASTNKGSSLRWQAGVMYHYDNIMALTHYEFVADPRCGQECNFGLGASTGFIEENLIKQRRKSYAGYLRLEYDIVPAVTVSAGIRQSHDRISVPLYDATMGDRAAPTAFHTINDYSLKTSFDNTSFEAGLSWKIDRNIMAYGSFKQGYRTGAINGGAFNSSAEVTIAPPEKADNFEIGFKSTFLDNAVTFNAALFHTAYKNQQYTNTENGTFPLRSIPKARIRGAEFELEVRPVRNVTLGGSLSLLDPKYLIGNVSGVDIAGNRMSNASKVASTLYADFTSAETWGGKFHLNLSATYTGKYYNDVANKERLSQEGYWLAGGRISFDTDRFSVGVGVKNIFNKKYSVYNFDDALFGFDYLQRGLPRQIVGDVTYRF